MKNSWLSTDGMASMRKSHQEHKPLFIKLRHAGSLFFKKLGQIEVAIVLSEAGDVDGAKTIMNQFVR